MKCKTCLKECKNEQLISLTQCYLCYGKMKNKGKRVSK
jgi:hypothetical protein